MAVEEREARVLWDHLPEEQRVAVRALDAAQILSVSRPPDGTAAWADLLAELRVDEGVLAERCPVLQGDGRCAAYAFRPTICRTFMVTSPPENCEHPEDGGVSWIRPGPELVTVMPDPRNPQIDYLVKHLVRFAAQDP